MEDSSLAPHLNHATSTAWFNPITLMANLPSSVREAKETEQHLAMIHENVHYIQATTTFFGIYRFLKVWESITELADILTKSGQRDLTKDQKEQLKAKFWKNNVGAKARFRMEPFFITNQMPQGPYEVEFEDDHFPAYCKVFPDQRRKLYFYDTVSLQETMALALELWYGFSAELYEDVVKQPELGFHYVVGTEAIKDLTGWEDQSALMLSIILSDIALNHSNPNHVFFYGMAKASEKWKQLPPVEELSEVYRFLFNEFELPEMKLQREMIRHELEYRVSQLLTAVDPFDRALAGLFQVMLTGIDKRENEPEAFVRFLLRDIDDKEFIDTFTMPSFVSQNRVMTINTNQDFTNAPLFVAVAYHFLTAMIEETDQPECPLLNLKACGFEKTSACHQKPWAREFKNSQEVCMYRFVYDAFFCVP